MSVEGAAAMRPPSLIALAGSSFTANADGERLPSMKFVNSKAICYSWMLSPLYSPGTRSKPPASISTPAVNGGNAVNEESLAPLPKPAEVVKDLKRWTKRATKGDKTAKQALRQLLDHPNCFRLFCDLAGLVRKALTRRFAGDDWFTKELIEKELSHIRAELLGPAPTMIERLLVERVAIGWLAVQADEYRLAACQPEYRTYWQRQVDHASQRFFSAMRLLTAVRRIPRPAVQVNIGEQQVNVSG
jgi:hypothetical protein